ncbi:unnamed protein product [Owenia fusiformis]|uniref:Uncharacterized protein n=1 Tax=Owenia fusiformis TaxID=6347 RepID=A0A8J1TU55_OWEFU|nr:unnamed protein product [Owenia fusiformis]
MILTSEMSPNYSDSTTLGSATTWNTPTSNIEGLTIGSTVAALKHTTTSFIEAITLGTTLNDTLDTSVATTELFTVREANDTDPDALFIHPHWRQFDIEGIPAIWHYAVGIFITIVGITGMTGNFLVIYMFSSVKALRTPQNMLLINLAISDFTFSAVNGFPLLTISSFNQRWMWGNATCKFYAFIGAVFGFMSIDTLAVISYQRYKVIKRPMEAVVKMTHKRTAVWILAIWIWAVGWSLPPFFGWGDYIPEGFQTSCTFDYLTLNINNITFNLTMYMIHFVLPVGFITYNYVGIVRAVLKQKRILKDQASKMKAKMTSADKRFSTEISLARTCSILCVLYLLSWGPYATVALAALLNYQTYVTPFVSELPVMFAKASACYDPIVYALSHPRFRTELYRKFPCLCSCLRPPPGFGSTANSHGRTDSRHGSQMSQSSVTETSVDHVPMPNKNKLKRSVKKVQNSIRQQKQTLAAKTDGGKDNAAYVADEEANSKKKSGENELKTISGAVEETEAGASEKNNQAVDATTEL